MAYNKKNRLQRIIDIQQLVLEHTREHGSTQEWVYQQIVYPKYRISRAAFYHYLSTNAKMILRKIQDIENKQTKLF